MRTFTILALLFFGLLLLLQTTRASEPPAGLTNHLAFHLVTDRVSSAEATLSFRGLQLAPHPILSDSDFVAWDTTSAKFVITPAAAKRLAASGIIHRPTTFVLTAEGEPIYKGVFAEQGPGSSRLYEVPVINPNSILHRCFMGITNVPAELRDMIGPADPQILARLNALTNAVTNVVLWIEEGFFHGPMDVRDDKRVTAAVANLFGNTRK